MLIVMKVDATDEEIKEVERVITELGYRPHSMPGAARTAIGITGNSGAVDITRFETMPGVAEAIRVTKPYKLVTLDLRPEKTVIKVGGDASIGGEELAIIAGPCAVENREQLFAVAEAVKKSGARNMQNFSLLRRAGRARIPVLLNRVLSAMLDEWLLAAEYIMAEGNYNVILCERGVRTFAQHTRNTLDLAAIPAVRRISHLPVVIDPSHGTGKNHMVTPLARAGVAVGADGLIIEVHDHPERALSDGAQSLTLEQYEHLVPEVRAIHDVIAPAPVG